jgi:hypothetical protein
MRTALVDEWRVEDTYAFCFAGRGAERVCIQSNVSSRERPGSDMDRQKHQSPLCARRTAMLELRAKGR